MSLEMTKELKEGLAHLYYRQACDQKGWAYVPLYDMEIRDNVVIFTKGLNRISIRLPDQVIAEIRQISKLGSPCKPVFDYLSCQVSRRDKYEGVVVANPTALAWVQVQVIQREFSEAEISTLERLGIPLALFYIRNILAQPSKVEVKWIIKTGDEWLDDLDDKRNQAESDDDFL